MDEGVGQSLPDIIMVFVLIVVFLFVYKMLVRVSSCKGSLVFGVRNLGCTSKIDNLRTLSSIHNDNVMLFLTCVCVRRPDRIKSHIMTI